MCRLPSACKTNLHNAEMMLCQWVTILLRSVRGGVNECQSYWGLSGLMQKWSYDNEWQSYWGGVREGQRVSILLRTLRGRNGYTQERNCRFITYPLFICDIQPTSFHLCWSDYLYWRTSANVELREINQSYNSWSTPHYEISYQILPINRNLFLGIPSRGWGWYVNHLDPCCYFRLGFNLQIY